MKTTMMAGVCLLALVLTFTIAECGPSQEKRQASCNKQLLQDCITACERAEAAGGSDAALTQCKEACEAAYGCSGDDDGSDDGNGSDDDDDDDDDDDNEDSGATAIAGATIFSTISAFLVVVASAMN